MELKIGNSVKQKKLPKNCYKLIINLMEGDADSYPKIKEFFKESDEKEIYLLKLYLEFLEFCKKSGFGTEKCFEIYNEKFLEDDNILGTEVSISEIISEIWHHNYEMPSEYVNHSLTYFNEFGEEFEVKIIE